MSHNQEFLYIIKLLKFPLKSVYEICNNSSSYPDAMIYKAFMSSLMHLSTV